MKANDLAVLEEEQVSSPPRTAKSGYLKIHQLKKKFDGGEGSQVTVFDRVDLEISEGEFVAVFGPNGCGKTTLLRILAGIEREWTGEVTIDGRSPFQVECGFVFQDFQRTLLPWLTHMKNLCLPIEISSGASRQQSEQRVLDFLKMLRIEGDWLSKYPRFSNDGEQQLASFLRAFVFDPKLVLMDEPFSSLDFHHQLKLKEMLLALWQETKQTILFVSHTLEDSLYLADRLIVLSPKPSRIVLDYRILFPRPRTPKLVKSVEFSEMLSEVRSCFLEECL